MKKELLSTSFHLTHTQQNNYHFSFIFLYTHAQKQNIHITSQCFFSKYLHVPQKWAIKPYIFLYVSNLAWRLSTRQSYATLHIIFALLSCITHFISLSNELTCSETKTLLPLQITFYTCL